MRKKNSKKSITDVIWSLPISFTLRAIATDSIARKAFVFGVLDGLRAERETDETYIGMTWANNQDANEAYDGGANFGQRVGRLVMRVTDAPFAALQQDDEGTHWRPIKSERDDSQELGKN